MDLNLSDFRNLDPNNIGSWPVVARAGVIVILCAAILGAGYYFDTKEQEIVLEQAKAEEVKLRKTFETKQKKAANLDAYKNQMGEMEESFGTMLRQLPSKTEVAELLVDITQTGLASGLEFSLFQPKGEVPKEFYAELPIVLTVSGGYHQIGDFISGVAGLPRIVTLHDITLNESQGTLEMDAVAKTYRYLDEEEILAQASKKQQRGRRR